MKWPEATGIYSTDVFNRPIKKLSQPKVSKVTKQTKQTKQKIVKEKVVKVKVPKKVKVKKVKVPKKKPVAAKIVTPTKESQSNQFTITQLYDESDVF